MNVDKLYSATALMEEVDPVFGIKSAEYAKTELVKEQDEVNDPEFAIIGFWSLKETGVFRCVQSFEVPNPMKREVADVEGTSL